MKISNICALVIVLTFLWLNPAFGKEKYSKEGYQVAMDFVSSFFINFDKDQITKLVSSQATAHTHAPGSGITFLLDGMEDSPPDYFSVSEVMFFNRSYLLDKVNEIRGMYTILKADWQTTLYTSILVEVIPDSAVCCIVVYSEKTLEEPKTTSPFICLFIFDKEPDGYKLIHVEDII